ncbi:Synaptic vesicle 2-related protein [Aphelenchoides besseyi]|nr:Synaptic vesicle 2-related protein [Aphelenchoides besseyi]
MGDKAFLTEVLEASHLTDTYSNLTAKSIIKHLRTGGDDGRVAVRYEGLDGDMLEIKEPDDANRSNDEEGQGTSMPSGDSFTVDEAVEFLGFGKFQLTLSFLTGLAWMADAMEMMILSILSPALYCEWEITAVEQAMITTVVFSGMMLSSTVWGKICDRFGRRTGLMCSALLTFSMGALSSVAPNFKTLLFFRGLTGIGIGGVPQSVTLYAEFLPLAQRAKCVVLIESFWAVGAAFEAVLALFIMETMGWRWLLLFSSLPLLIFAICCFWLPESARYMMASGKPEEAYAILQKVAHHNGKKLPPGKLVESTKTSGSIYRGNVSNLFVDELFKTTILLWFIWSVMAVNAFCYYGVVLFTTVLFQSEDNCHGGQPNNNSLTGCRPLVQKDYIDLLSTTLSEFPGLIVTAVIIEWFGRKKTMAIEFGVYSFFMLLLFFCMGRGWVTVFIFIARAFISGAFQCVYVYTPEVYPTTLRAIGLGASSSMARLGAIITPFVAQVASGHSLYIPIAVYGTTSLLGLVAALSLPIETKRSSNAGLMIITNQSNIKQTLRIHICS